MKKKIGVLHAQVPFEHGGAEILSQRLTEELIFRGFDAEIIQIPYKWYPEYALYDSMLAWRMVDLSESNGSKIDLVIGQKFPSYGVQHKNKVVWLVHQYRQAYDLFDSPYGLKNTPQGETIQKNVMKYDEITLGEARRIFTISQNNTNRLLKYNNIHSTPLYNPPGLIGRYYCGSYQNYILSVGRLDPLKRVDLLIKALPECDPNIRLKIAGKGQEKESLRQLAASLKVEERIDFLGFVSDEEVLDLYANAAGIYFSPVDEDYGYITLEAFLSEKPVITCEDSGGVLEFVSAGINGFVCKPEPESIAQAINEISGDPHKCRNMGQAGYDRVKDITWDNVIAHLTATL